MSKESTKGAWPKFQRREDRKVSLLASDEEQRQQVRDWAREDLEKLIQIRDLLGIDNLKGWELRLALELALEQRSATKYLEPSKKRRPVKWTHMNRSALAVEHRRVMEEHCLDETDAFTFLIRRSPWIDVVSQNDVDEATRLEEGQTLRQQRDMADKRWVELLTGALCLHQQQDTLSEWHSFVEDVVKNPQSQ